MLKSRLHSPRRPRRGSPVGAGRGRRDADHVVALDQRGVHAARWSRRSTRSTRRRSSCRSSRSSEMVQKYATAAAGGSAPDLVSLDLVYTPAFAAVGPARGPDGSRQEPALSSISSRRRIWAPAPIRAASTACRCRRTPRCCSGTRSCSGRRASTLRRARPTGPRSRSMPARSNALGGDINGFYFPGACGGCNAFTFMPLVWASGGDILVDGGKRATLDTPQMRDAIELLSRHRRQGLHPEERQDRFRRQLLRRLRHRQDRHLAGRRLRHRQPRQEVSGRRVRRDVPARARTAAGHPSRAATISSSRPGARTWRRSRSSSTSSIRSKARPCWPRRGSLPTRGDIAAEAVKDLDSRYLDRHRGHGDRPHARSRRSTTTSSTAAPVRGSRC